MRDIVLAVDPGTFESAYVVLDGPLILEYGKIENEQLAWMLQSFGDEGTKHGKGAPARFHFVIEMVASYGMPVGKTTFETVFWIGRFWERAANFDMLYRLYRKTDIGKYICPKQRVKDSTIRAGVIKLLGPVGTSKNPGPTYGISGDVWSALAVGLTYQNKFLKPTDFIKHDGILTELDVRLSKPKGPNCLDVIQNDNVNIRR